MKASDVVSKMYQAYNPGETIQANKIRAGALLKALGMKPGEALNEEHLSMLEKIMKSEHPNGPETEIKIPDSLQKMREEAGFPNPKDPMDITQQSIFRIVSDIGKNLGEKEKVGGDIDLKRQAALGGG